MKKNTMRFFSMLLAFCMVFGLVAVPVNATGTVEEPAAVVEPRTTGNVALEPAVEEETEAAPTFNIEGIRFNAPLLMANEEVQIDETDPAIISVTEELKNMKVLNAEGESVPLTEEEIQQILYMYQQYLDHWEANADLLGVQTPFFLAYNDKEDSLGILGEMLVMANIPLAAVRAGQVKASDITGMIENFLYADMLGIEYYGDDIKAARNEISNLIKNSGAITDVQEYLVLNSWLAQNTTFDMPYIMNSGKEEGSKPMVAEDPQKHENYDNVYNVIYADYEKNLTATFEQNIVDGLKGQMKIEFYKAAIQQGYAQGAQANGATEEEANAAAEQFVADNAEAIAADPEGFTVEAFGEDAAADIAAQWDATWADWEANGIPGMIAQIKLTAYQSAIKDALVQNGQTEEEADAFLQQNADAIAADPYAFVAGAFGEEAAAQMDAGIDAELKKMGLDPSTETNPEGRVALEIIVAMQMDTPQQDPMLQKPDGSYMTPNEAVAAFSNQAAEGLTEGVINYWQGSHFGALGRGTAVCLGYTKAFTYLVQYLHPEVYGVDGEGTNMSVAANWKDAADLYYDADGNLDITQNYVVDTVRITFDASVTMFGQTQDNFNSDHFWNAVKVDGKWYYIDPCYTDVYTEVMMRDRVETDGYMNHLYFMFSHPTCVDLYEGNYKEIKTLYADVATDATYEDSWMSRIKSNLTFNGGYAYYIYDSTDLVSLMEEYEEENTFSMEEGKLMFVRHLLDDTDTDISGDEDFEILIEFNYTADEDSEDVVRVLDPDYIPTTAAPETTAPTDPEATTAPVEPEETTAPTDEPATAEETTVPVEPAETTAPVEPEETTAPTEPEETEPTEPVPTPTMVEDELLSALYDQFVEDQETYASLYIGGAFYNGKLYFTLSNCICCYDPATGDVTVVKEYNTIHGQRDKTNPFGGMAFSVVSNADNADFTVYDRPIAGMTIKNDGKMYVSIATNFAFISGKDPHNSEDQSSFGYEFEESNYNSAYSNYNSDQYNNMYEQMGYKKETNDNDEFMWSANFVDTFNASSLGAGSRAINGYAEHEHHYVRFDEVYYTKDDNGNWNTGHCYVCVECSFAIEEPVKPTQNSMSEQMGGPSYEEQLEEYEKEKAVYDAAVAAAGHTREIKDPTWSEDGRTLSFSHIQCTDAECVARAHTIDVLVEEGKSDEKLAEPHVVDATIKSHTGTCATGVTITYSASGTYDELKFDYSTEVKKAAGEHTYTDAVCDICGEGMVTRIYGSNRYETAIAAADVLKAEMGVSKFENIVVACGTNFADALSGSYLANVKKAPILLVNKNNVDSVVSYIEDSLAANGTVYLLGGTAAIPETLDDGLKKAEIDYKRLAGDNRYETNLLILEEAGIEGEDLLVCTGDSFADSLSASATNRPIMLVNKRGLTAEQQEFLAFISGNVEEEEPEATEPETPATEAPAVAAEEDGTEAPETEAPETEPTEPEEPETPVAIVKNIYIIGGESAVSAALRTAINDATGLKATRISGENRYETSVKIAEAFFTKPTHIVLAYGQNFPDGLCAGTLAYTLKAPLILTRDMTKSYAVDYAVNGGVKMGLVLGGPTLIADETVKEVFSMLETDNIVTEQ